jgi:hypothetical protein
MCYTRRTMFRRVLSGLFVVALALAGAAVGPLQAERTAGWQGSEQPAAVQTGRADLRLTRASEGRGASLHQLLGLLPVVGAPQPARAVAALRPERVRVAVPMTVQAAHGARAPPA